MASKAAELLLKVKTVGAEAIDSLTNSLSAVKEIGMAAFAAISAVVVKSIDEYMEAEKANNALTQSMVNQGIYSKELKADYLAQAAALQQLTLFSDDQVVAAQTVLQSYLGQTKVSKELIQATLDLATAKKMDLNSAAELVGKSIGTETNALARNGIEVTANASQQQKLAEVISGLQGRWAGQAEAAAQGLGVLGRLQNVAGELFEAIGERLSPVVTLFANKLLALGTDAGTVTPILDAFVWTLQKIVQAGVVVSGIFEGVSRVIGVALGGTFEAITQAMEGRFAQAFETVKTQVAELGSIIPETYAATNERIKEVDAAFLASKQENHAREQELLAQNNASKLRVQADADKKLAIQNEAHRQSELKKQQAIDKLTVENRAATLNTIATLQSSNNSTLAAIGKAAAITQIAIDTPVAIGRALAAFPPPFNFAAAGLVGAAMAAQAAKVAGIPLAEGGIVRARPGGIIANIGEGGQDEAVIPLDRAGEFGFGGGGQVTVVFNGPVMGNESQAHDFAVAIDRELLKLRQNNESVSFDSGVV